MQHLTPNERDARSDNEMEKQPADKAREMVLAVELDEAELACRIFEAIGRDLDRGPDYLYVYNILNQMGILADVTFVTSGDNGRIYTDIDDAVKGLHWMLNDLTAVEESRLRTYLEHHLLNTKGGWVLSYKHAVRWAIISWHPYHHD